MRQLFLILLFSSTTFTLFAQDTLSSLRKNHIYVGSGYSKHIVKDEIISPLIYKGYKLPIWIKYKRYGNKYLHNISLFYNRVGLESSITNKDNYYSHNTDNINAYFAYGIEKKIHSIKNINLDIYLGAKFKSYINYRDHSYMSNIHSIIAEQNSSLDLNTKFMKVYNTQGDFISYNFNFPIIAYILMPDMYNANVSKHIYNVNASEGMALQYLRNGDFVSLNKFLEFQSELHAIKSIHKNIAIGLTHYLHYYSLKKHPDNQPVKYVNIQFTLDLIIKL